MAEAISHDARWQEYPGEEWSDALVQSMQLGGIEHLFFVSGLEIAFWPAGIAQANARDASHVRGGRAGRRQSGSPGPRKRWRSAGRWGRRWCAISLRPPPCMSMS